MRLDRTRRFSRGLRRFEGLLTQNPVLTLGLALPFVISAAVTLQAAVCVLIGVAAVSLPMIALSGLVGKRVSYRVMAPVYALGAMALLIPIEGWLTQRFPAVMNSLGVYFPIIAVNTLMLYFCGKCAERGSFPRAVWTGVMELCGFAAVILLAAGVRELFGNGTLWGAPAPWIRFRLGGLLIPFGGCITVAFAGAAVNFFGRLARCALYRRDLREPPSPPPGEDGEEDRP